MKTISFRFKYEDKHLQDVLLEDSRICSAMKRFVFNRLLEKKFEKGWFQPSFVSKQRLMQVLGNQWKEELGLGYQSWKGLSGEIKELKLKYRFQLNPSNAVFSKFHDKMLSYRYVF